MTTRTTVAHPEVKTVAVNLRRVRKAHRDPADIVGINHAEPPSRIARVTQIMQGRR
jgi:hypothetical protein